MKSIIDISDYSENLNWNAISQKEDGVIIKDFRRANYRREVFRACARRNFRRDGMGRVLLVSR